MQSPVLQDRDSIFIPHASWNNKRDSNNQFWISNDYSLTMPAAWNVVHEREACLAFSASQAIPSSAGFKAACMGLFMKAPNIHYPTEYELYAYDVVASGFHSAGTNNDLCVAQFWVGYGIPGGNGAVVTPGKYIVIDASDGKQEAGGLALPTLRSKGVIAIAPPTENQADVLMFGIAIVAASPVSQTVQVDGHLAVQRLTQAPPRTLDRRRS